MTPQEQAVILAADRLNRTVCRHPDYPEAWGRDVKALHEALVLCPGTHTHDEYYCPEGE